MRWSGAASREATERVPSSTAEEGKTELEAANTGTDHWVFPPSSLNFWFCGYLWERKDYFFPNVLTTKSAKGRLFPLPWWQAPSQLLRSRVQAPSSLPSSLVRGVLSSLSTLSCLLMQAYVLLVGWILSLGLSLLQRVGFTSPIFSCPEVRCVAYVLLYPKAIFHGRWGKIDFSRGSDEKTHRSPVAVSWDVSKGIGVKGSKVQQYWRHETPLKTEGRQMEIHPTCTRIAHIASWKDQFLSNDYGDLQTLH